MKVDVNTLQEEWAANTKKLLDYLAAVPDAFLFESPAENEWSVSECFEHLVSVERGLSTIFNGSTEAPDRDPLDKQVAIKERFLAFESKLKAFGPIIPKGRYKTRTDIVQAFNGPRQVVMALGEQAGWERVCTGFDHPLFGSLTKAEWLYFCIYHAERHLNQMKNAVALLSQQQQR